MLVVQKILGRTRPKYFSETVQKKLKIRVPYDNHESKYVTKNNKYIPYVVAVQSVVQKKKQIILINLFRRIKLRQRNKLMEICFNSLEHIEHILL